jgi:hypothetical protein
MKARRLLLDALVVVIGLALLASPCLIHILPFLPPFPKIRPYINRGRLIACAPSFGCETNAQKIYPTVLLTLSNAGPTDLDCQLEWFDCRATNDFAKPLPCSIAAGGTMSIRSGLAGRATLVGVSGSTTDQLFCYCVHWKEAASWMSRELAAHPVIDSVLRRVSVWPAQQWKLPPEEGWSFGANLGIDEYFELVYALNKPRWSEEEAREADQLDYAKKLQWATNVLEIRRLGPLSQASGFDKAVVDAAEAVLKTGEPRFQQDFTRRAARKAYGHWLYAQRVNQLAGRDSAEPGASPNAASPHR